MSVTLTVNGTDYEYPEVGDTNWGSQATGWASAVTSGMLQKAGGTFTLTAEVNFGATYGLKSAYYKTQTASNASAGAYRLARTDVVSWRNQADGANLDLSVTSGNVLQFNGEDIIAGAIVNADISASAAIAFSKMAALTASRLLVSDASGIATVSAVTSTEAGYLSGVTGAIQTALDAKLPLAGGTMTGDLFLNADPTATNQAATKNYVDNASAGNVNNFTVTAATTTAINIATDLENGDTLDGVVLATGQLVLVKDQASTPTHGVYVVPASGAASRYSGMDTWTEAIGASVFVTTGTANAGTNWKFNTAAGGTLGVTAIPIVQNGASQVYSASGEGIELSSTTFSLELDGTTLSVSGSGIKVNQIANAQIAAAAAIAVNKLAAVTASRALVSDGSGFVAASAVTSTTLAFLDATSSVQTQLDAKIAKTLTSTRGDMIYASSANTPARLAVGTSGYIIQSDGTDPVWTNPKISGSWFVSNASSYSIGTTFAALTLVAVTDSFGTPVTRTSNTFTFAFTGRHIICLNLGLVTGNSTRRVMGRIRNTTDGSTLASSVSYQVADGIVGMSMMFEGNVTDASKVYEVQLASSGTGVTVNSDSIDSQTAHLYQLYIYRPPQ